MTPQPFAPDRAALAAALDRDLAGKTDYSVLCLSDGLDYGEGDALTGAIAKLRGATGSFAMLRPGKDDAALALGQAIGESSGLTARVLAGEGGPRVGVVRAVTGRGEPLGEAPILHAEAARKEADREIRSAARDQEPGRPPRDRR